MNKKDAKRIVDANIKQMLWDLQINMWTVNVYYEAPECLTADADVRIQAEYKLAKIRIRYEKFSNATELLDILLHELFHIVLANFNLYHQIASECVRTKHESFMLNKAFTHADELAVTQLEDMFKHGLKYVYPQFRSAKAAPAAASAT